MVLFPEWFLVRVFSRSSIASGSVPLPSFIVKYLSIIYVVGLTGTVSVWQDLYRTIRLAVQVPCCSISGDWSLVSGGKRWAMHVFRNVGLFINTGKL